MIRSRDSTSSPKLYVNLLIKNSPYAQKLKSENWFMEEEKIGIE